MVRSRQTRRRITVPGDATGKDRTVTRRAAPLEQSAMAMTGVGPNSSHIAWARR